MTPVRSMPRTFARRTSASRRGVSEPAARSRWMESQRSASTVAIAGSAGRAGSVAVGDVRQPLGLVGRDEGVDEAIQLAVHHPGQARQVEMDAMVGHPVLRKVVGPDLVGSIARPDHRAAGHGIRLALPAVLGVLEAGPPGGRGPCLVLILALFVLDLDDQAGRQV